LHAELYRDIQGVHYGRSEALEQAFGEQGPFWGRHYLFWHHGKPLTLIYEVFSPYLRKYLGPVEGSPSRE
jgi:chorismate lyase